VWRARIDFRRNSISTLAQAHFSPKVLHGVNTKQMLVMLTVCPHTYYRDEVLDNIDVS